MKKIILIFAIFSFVLKLMSQKQDFTFKQYASFLEELSKRSDVVIMPLKDLVSNYDSTKIFVSITHDIDQDIETAIKLAMIENKYDIKATYFVLHTAKYYIDENNFPEHNQSVLLKILKIKDLGHEIGLHNDLVTLQVVYNISPTEYLSNELAWLENNGINIVGTASHGSPYCSKYGYLNYYFFYDCQRRFNSVYPNIDTVYKNGSPIILEKAWLSDFDFIYERYCIDFTKYFSDATVKNGRRYNPTTVDMSYWKPGDRIIFLFHPVYWGEDVNINVYPNPTVDFLYININNFILDDLVDISIYDITGRLVYFTQKNVSDKIFLSFNLEEGLYFLVLKLNYFGENFLYREKFVVIR